MTSSTGYLNPVVVVCPPDEHLSSVSLSGIQITYVTSENPVALSDLTGDTAISLPAKMHIRGQSSASAQKNQYAVHIKSDPANGTHFLDMKHGGKRWVFNAPGMANIDLSLVRNALTFHTQRKLGQWAPRTKFFELFLYQGQPGTDDPSYFATALQDVIADPDTYYRGIYCNMEKIRQESHRIDQPVYDANTLPVGAFVMQLNPGSAEYETMAGDNANLPYTADVQLYEPKANYFETAPSQLTDIRNWYNTAGQTGWGVQFKNALADPAGTNWSAIAASTDYASFATYFLLNELANDPDGYHKSAFLYKSPDSSGSPGQCFAGPMWDKNKSYGNTQLAYEPTYQNTSGWNYTRQNGGQSPVWWHALTQDPGFLTELLSQWTAASAQGGVLTADWQSAYIDDQVTGLTASGALDRNNTLWGISAYSSQIDALKSYITARLAWMGTAVPALCAGGTD